MTLTRMGQVNSHQVSSTVDGCVVSKAWPHQKPGKETGSKKFGSAGTTMECFCRNACHGSLKWQCWPCSV